MQRHLYLYFVSGLLQVFYLAPLCRLLGTKKLALSSSALILPLDVTLRRDFHLKTQ